MTGIVRLRRVIRVTPDKLYRAFLDPEALAKWLPPHGFTCKVHEMDARVGAATACPSPTSPLETVTRSAPAIPS